MDGADSPGNKHAQSRNNNTQEDGEQGYVKRRRLTQDEEFRGTGEEIKERLGDCEVPQDKKMQTAQCKPWVSGYGRGGLRLVHLSLGKFVVDGLGIIRSDSNYPFSNSKYLFRDMPAVLQFD